MEKKDFKFMKILHEDDESVTVIPVVSSASNKDHNDIHYLYKHRKALLLLVGEKNMSGYTEQQIMDIHVAVVRVRIDQGNTHWYEEWDSDLDSLLPEDLKMASNGYDPPPDSSLFDLEELEYRKLLEENDVLNLWSVPTKREKIPSSHFLDKKKKKYPYKSADGTISCKGLQTAYNYAKGARGAPKKSGIAAKAKKLLDQHCGEKKANAVVGKLSKSL